MVSSAKNDNSDAQDRMLDSVPGVPALGRGPAPGGGFRVTSMIIRLPAGARPEAWGTC